jgi:hypothetical protein
MFSSSLYSHSTSNTQRGTYYNLPGCLCVCLCKKSRKLRISTKSKMVRSGFKKKVCSDFVLVSVRSERHCYSNNHIRFITIYDSSNNTNPTKANVLLTLCLENADRLFVALMNIWFWKAKWLSNVARERQGRKGDVCFLCECCLSAILVIIRIRMKF